MGPAGWKLLSSAQPQTAAKEAGDASGPRATPSQAKPGASPWRRWQDPPPPSSQSLDLLIWPWNARYPHSQPPGPRLLSRATATRTVPPHLQVWVGDSSPSQGAHLDIPEGLGRTGLGGDPSSSRTTKAALASRHAEDCGHSAWRPERLTRAESGEGGGNPRVSQLVPVSGARFRRSAGPGATRDPRHARLHAPSPRERRGAGATQSRSFSFQNKATPPRGDWRREPLRETEAERQTAGSGRLSTPGAPPLGLEAPGRAAPFAPVQSESARRGALHPQTHSPKPRSRGTLSCLPVSS